MEIYLWGLSCWPEDPSLKPMVLWTSGPWTIVTHTHTPLMTTEVKESGHTGFLSLIWTWLKSSICPPKYLRCWIKAGHHGTRDKNPTIKFHLSHKLTGKSQPSHWMAQSLRFPFRMNGWDDRRLLQFWQPDPRIPAANDLFGLVKTKMS